MEDLGHLIESLLEAEAPSACFDDVFHVSSHGATGKASQGQRIKALEGDRRWIPFLWESGALAPRSEAVCLAGARARADRSAWPLWPQDRQRSGSCQRESQEPALSWARAAWGKAGVGRRGQGSHTWLRAEAAGESKAVEAAVPVLSGAGGCAGKGPEEEGEGEGSQGEKDARCERDAPCLRS